MSDKKDPTKPAFAWICPECDGKGRLEFTSDEMIDGAGFRHAGFSSSSECRNCKGDRIVWTEKAHPAIIKVPDYIHQITGTALAGKPIPCGQITNAAPQLTQDDFPDYEGPRANCKNQPCYEFQDGCADCGIYPPWEKRGPQGEKGAEG